MHVSVDLGNLVRETLHQFIGQQPKLIPFSLQIQPQLPQMLGKKALIRTAIYHLLEVARDILKPDDSLTLSVAELQGYEQRPQFPDAELGPYIQIKLSFTNGSVPHRSPHDCPSLLSACSIVAELRGTLKIDSLHSYISGLSLFLPLTIRAKGKVLVADDDEFVLSMLSSALTAHGFEVLMAKDGREALDLFKTNRARIALLLLDFSMPKLSGKDLVSEVRKLDLHKRIILTSGYGAEVGESLPEGDPHTVYLSKPYNLADLFNTIQTLLQ